MDKRSVLGFVLITVIIITWLIYSSTQSIKVQKLPEKKPDSTQIAQEAKAIDSLAKKAAEQQPVQSDSVITAEKYGRFFAKFASGTEKTVTIETDLVKAVVSSKGGTILQWQLKNYKKWDKKPTQLIWDDGGELYLTFLTFDNKKIDSRALFFTLDNAQDSYRISGDRSLTLNATLEVAPGKTINKRFTFFGNKYIVESDITLNNLEDIIPARGYNFAWSDGLAYQEHNSVDESSDAVAVADLNGEIEEVDATKDQPVESSPTGLINYAAVKIKYFTAAIMPKSPAQFDGTVDITGRRNYAPNSGVVERYGVSFRIPYKGGTQTNKFDVYIGPLQYDIVKSYGLEALINFGWRLVVRPIGEYFMLPIFKFIHSFVPNYGIALIIFSLLMKFLLYPFSIQQMRSAQKMKLLQPEMEKIREKFKEDNTKQQQETMKLYSEYGINPAGGCLPMLMQMPILYALWAVLRTAIDLRQADFFLWIKDLSVPDVLVNVGFKVPIFGVDQFSGLAILMGVTMFIQQKMTVTDPRQKAMVWMMPVLFTLMFSNFPSGLNLYYFMFNLWSILQQYYINKFSSKQLTLADLKRMPKKEGWLQKKMREAQDIAASQGRSVPGAKYESDDKGHTPAAKKRFLPKTSPTQGKKKK